MIWLPRGRGLALMLAASVASAEGASAQVPAVTLSGVVFDSVLHPLPDALVYVSSGRGSSFVFTDSVGTFHLPDVAPGVDTLHVRKRGFESRSFRIDVPDHLPDTVNVGPIHLSAGAAPTLTLEGAVVDSVGHAAVNEAEILVNGVRAAASDMAGHFGVGPITVNWGPNVVTVRRLGYVPQHLLLWVDGLDDRLAVTVTMERLAVRLPEVVVEGDRTVLEFGRLREFWRRRRMGLGTFFARWEIEERNPLFTSDLLRRVPGVTVRRGARGAVIRFLRGGGCVPRIWLDGMPLPGDLDLDSFVPPDHIEAMEIYKGPSQTPVQFNPAGTACGAIVIWTR